MRIEINRTGRLPRVDLSRKASTRCVFRRCSLRGEEHCSIAHGATGLTPPLRMPQSAMQPGARVLCAAVRKIRKA
eukprot:1346665-Prymnesium_polylepis.1